MEPTGHTTQRPAAMNDKKRNGTVFELRRKPAEPPQNATAAPTAPSQLWREVLGREIRHQRTIRHERLKDTAERAGISPQYLSELERGMKDPSSEILEAVAGALGMSSLDLTHATVRTWRTPTNGTSASGPILLDA